MWNLCRRCQQRSEKRETRPKVCLGTRWYMKIWNLQTVIKKEAKKLDLELKRARIDDMSKMSSSRAMAEHNPIWTVSDFLYWSKFFQHIICESRIVQQSNRNFNFHVPPYMVIMQYGTENVQKPSNLRSDAFEDVARFMFVVVLHLFCRTVWCRLWWFDGFSLRLCLFCSAFEFISLRCVACVLYAAVFCRGLFSLCLSLPPHTPGHYLWQACAGNLGNSQTSFTSQKEGVRFILGTALISSIIKCIFSHKRKVTSFRWPHMLVHYQLYLRILCCNSSTGCKQKFEFFMLLFLVQCRALYCVLA